MEEVKEIKSKDAGCPSCGATMRYVPEKQKLFCDSCETCKEIDFEKIEEKHWWRDRLLDTTSKKQWEKEVKNMKCTNCGASVVLNKLEYSKSCPYCDSDLIGAEVLNDVAPDGIIPFKFSDEDASQKYVKGIRKKFFIPNAFKKAPPTQNIKGIYIPSFAFDADTVSKYDGKLAEDERYTYSNGNRRTRTTYKSISGTHKQSNVDVMVESSSKLNQKQLQEILPYNMAEVVKFDQSFIMGYTVEHYENEIEQCKEISKRIMEENIKKSILSKYSYDRVCYFNMQTEYSNEKYMYYLMPTYKCDYMFKNKKYTTFMNGQTGKVGGGYPLSKIKITFFVLFILAIIGGITALVYMF